MTRCATRLGVMAVALVVAGVLPSVHAGAGKVPEVVPTGRFSALDTSMRDRVESDGLDGGVLFIGRNGTVVHQVALGSVTSETVIPIASASTWLTAATLMTFVDEGRLALDDPVADHVRGFDGRKRDIRVRHLLAHTSALAYDTCLGDPDTTTVACVARVANGPDPSDRPGTQFVYSSVGYEVVGLIVESLTDMSFEEAFQARIARPIGMVHTRFDVFDGDRARHPAPATSAVSTVTDYSRFLAMLANDGTIDGRRVLSAGAVAEIERDQVEGIATRRDPAARVTDIPTYGLGVWRDIVGPRDEIRVVSGSGAYGFYPWIDRRHGTYGIVGVADLYNGAEHTVPASQRQARASWKVAATAP